MVSPQCFLHDGLMKNSKASKRNLGCLGTGLGILILLPVLSYFLLKNPRFLRSVVIPRVESTADIELEFEEIDFDPFHRLKVESVTLKAPAQGVSGNLHSFTARYKLLEFVRGEMRFEEISVVRPDITIDLKQMQVEKDDKESDGEKNTTGSDIWLRNVVVKDATIDLINGEESIRITGSLNMSELHAGGEGEVSTSGTFRIPAPLAEKTQKSSLSGRFDAKLDMSLTHDFQPNALKGNLNVRTDEMNGFEPVALTFTTETSFSPEEEEMTVRDLSGSGTYGQREVLKLSLKNPAKLDFTKAMLLASDTRLEIIVQDVNLGTIPFMRDLPIREGLVNLSGEVLAEKQGEEVRAELKFRFQDLGGILVGTETDSWDLTGSLMAFGDPETIRISESTLNLDHAKENVFTGSLNAAMDSDFEQGNAEGTIDSLKLDAFKPFVAQLGQLSGRVQGELNLKWTPDQWVVSDTHMTVRDLRTEGMSAVPSPLNLKLEAQQETDVFRLKTLLLTWPESGSYTNRLTVSGDLNPGGDNGPGGTLELTGERVDLTPWLSESTDEANTDVSGDKEIGSDNWLPNEEPSLFPLPVDGLEAELKFNQVKVPGVELEDLQIKARIQPERAEISLLRFAMIDGEADGSASLFREGDLPAYTMQMALTPTNIQPLLKKVEPEEAGAAKGILEGRINLTGTGVTGPNVKKSLKGRAELDLRDGRVFLLKEEGHRGMIKIESLTHLILDTLAATLKLPPEELKAPPVTRLTLRLDVNNGLLDIREFEGRNQNLRLRTEGQVRLKDDVKASELNRLPIKIGVSEDLAERAKVYQEKRFQDGYVNLPVFLNVEGTLEDPGIDINRSVITGLVLTGVGENSGIGDAKVQSVLKGIGGLLSEGELPLDLFDSGKESEQ